MSALQNKAIDYIQKLSDEKLNSAVYYLKFLSEQECPLDEFDYELARRADEDTSDETVSFDEALKECAECVIGLRGLFANYSEMSVDKFLERNSADKELEQ